MSRSRDVIGYYRSHATDSHLFGGCCGGGLFSCCDNCVGDGFSLKFSLRRCLERERDLVNFDACLVNGSRKNVAQPIEFEENDGDGFGCLVRLCRRIGVRLPRAIRWTSPDSEPTCSDSFIGIPTTSSSCRSATAWSATVRRAVVTSGSIARAVN